MSTALLPKLLRTPMSRLVRGKIGPEATSTSLLEESALPGEAKALIARVVKKTRLWAREKREVAEELADHFSAALEGGGSVEEAVAAFGDADKAAKLIRRGKMRNRPLWWKVWRLARNFAGIVLLAYAGVAVAFLAGHPTVTTDYVAQYNAMTLSMPADQRGWPLYKSAIDKLDAAFAELKTSSHMDEKHLYAMLDSGQGHKRWGDLVAFVGSHRDIVDLARAGSERPAMGYEATVEPGPDSFGMVDVTLPSLNHLRQLATFVEADSRVARSTGNAERFVADVKVLLGIGQQMNGRATLVEQLVGIGIAWMGCEEIDRALATDSPRLGESELAQLGHLLARSPQHLDMAAERLFFYDCIQRIYTDNGNGNGYLSRSGLSKLRFARTVSGGNWTWKDESTNAFMLVAFSASPAVVASRKDAVAEYDRLMDMTQRNMDLPMRDANWKAVQDRRDEMRRPGLTWARYMVVSSLFPNLEHAQANSERLQAKKEALTAAIACESFKRKHGTYPDRLDELVPALLPSTPADRINGQPLHYKLVNGKPFLYSVGVDGIDDGGKTPWEIRGHRSPRYGSDEPARWDRWRGAPIPKGDWVLFPDPDSRGPAADPSDELPDAVGK